MVPEDLYLLRQVTDCALHPDGEQVAYVVGWADRETDSNRSQLWLHLGTSTRQLTFGHADGHPVFSPDGQWLAFLSSAKGSPPQLKVLPMGGGEPVTLTTADDGVGEPVWLPDSRGLVFTAATRPEHQRGKTTEELQRSPEPRRITTTQYRYNARGWIQDRWHHVFAIRLPGADGIVTEPLQLTDGDFDDQVPQPSPDGRTVAFISARHADREWVGGNDVWTVPIRGGTPTARTRHGDWADLRWHPDGQQLLLVGTADRLTIQLKSVFTLALKGRSVPDRIGDGEVSCSAAGNSPMFLRDNNLYIHGVRRGAVHIDRYDRSNGVRTTVIGGDRTVSTFAMHGDRTVFVASGTNTPTELFERVGKRERQLTNVSTPFLDEVELAPVTETSFVASDGTPVHAFVCTPAGKGRHPGLLYIHGGPLSHYGWGFQSEFQIAAAAGYVVVGPNPRGSDGYGQAHADAITGDFGNLDWVDIQAAADFLADRPDVDAKRLGIGGGSYGGFMTAWATARTHRFKAALVERAVINWPTMEATSDIGWFMQRSTGANTLTDIESMRRQSPITYVTDVKTPTLIVHSEEDWRCPIEQGEQWFAALRRLGVDTEFIRVPGENHELTRSGTPSLRIARLHIVHQWWAKFLSGRPFVTDAN
jgi:dipeptidyl aminopeptidase/acylaminoacyl peptidase